MDFTLKILLQMHGVAGAREKFEQLCALLIKNEFPDAVHIRVEQGDGGVDAALGRWDGTGEMIVYQHKCFWDNIGPSQKQQIRDSFRTALRNPRFHLGRWILCMPLDLSADERVWWDTWRQAQAVPIDLWGDTELQQLLAKEQNRGIKEAFFAEEFRTQIREVHAKVMAQPDHDVAMASEQHFDCGSRLRIARQDLGLGVSAIVEALGLDSERRFAEIEQGEKECPASLIEQVSAFSGVSAQWLKHGHGPKYPPLDLSRIIRPGGLQLLDELAPEQVYVCTDKRFSKVVLAVRFNEYYWKAGVLGFGLRFWEWVEDFGFIPHVYRFFQSLHRDFFEIVEGGIITTEDTEALESGSHHPYRIVFSARRKNFSWSEDIVDLEYRQHDRNWYQRKYNRDFIRVQELFAYWLQREPEFRAASVESPKNQWFRRVEESTEPGVAEG